MLLLGNAYAALDRVDKRDLDYMDQTLRASDIPLSSYLNNVEDEDFLRFRMETVVSRIMVQHMHHFKGHYEEVVLCHVPHRHREESAKSELKGKTSFL